MALGGGQNASSSDIAITPTGPGLPFPGSEQQRKISFVLQEDIQAISGSQLTLAVQVKMFRLFTVVYALSTFGYRLVSK